MRFLYSTVVMAGILAILVQPLAAQSPAATPNTVRALVSQSTSAKPAPAVKASAKPVAQAAPKPVAPAAKGPRRDPFNPLLNTDAGKGGGSPQRLPPGKAGLMVGTLHIDGLVRGPNGMIAVVSNPQQRIYFLREGDRIFDGRVLRITMEAVSFEQTGRDAFGNSLEREVTRRLYPNPGEQQ
jgi:Tfp pilus assembly protein PilP